MKLGQFRKATAMLSDEVELSIRIDRSGEAIRPNERYQISGYTIDYDDYPDSVACVVLNHVEKDIKNQH